MEIWSYFYSSWHYIILTHLVVKKKKELGKGAFFIRTQYYIWVHDSSAQGLADCKPVAIVQQESFRNDAICLT